MSYNKFLNRLNQEELLPLYLFMGEEEYLMNEAITYIKDKYIGKDFEELNFTIMDNKDLSFHDIINACETLPFMSSKKIVIVKDMNIFLDKSDPSEDMFYKYLENLGDFVTLIFIDALGLIKKNTKIYRSINKLQGAVEFSKLGGRELNLWVNRVLNRNNKTMSYSDINYFIQKTAYLSRNQSITLYDLENELLKLINFATGEKITKEEIDFNIIKSTDSNIFDLLENISRKNSQSAILILNQLYIQNEPIPRILTMIIRQIRLMLSYKLYKMKGYGEREINNKLQIKTYEFSKISSQANNFTSKQLEDGMNLLLSADKSIKTTGGDEKLALEILIINLCHII